VHLLADNISDWDSVVDAFEQLVTYFSTVQQQTITGPHASSSSSSSSSSSAMGGVGSHPHSHSHSHHRPMYGIEDRDVEKSCVTIER
jgi:hypothetical protein